MLLNLKMKQRRSNQNNEQKKNKIIQKKKINKDEKQSHTVNIRIKKIFAAESTSAHRSTTHTTEKFI